MHPKIALTILLAAVAVSLSAQNRGADLQLTKITRNLISTPEFNYSGAETFRTNTRDRWLEVEVEFAAAPDFTEAATIRLTGTKSRIVRPSAPRSLR